MSNVMDDFAHLDFFTPTQLFERRTELIGMSPSGEYKDLSDLTLQELVAIARVLKRRTSTTKPSVSRKGANAVPSLDAI